MDSRDVYHPVLRNCKWPNGTAAAFSHCAAQRGTKSQRLLVFAPWASPHTIKTTGFDRLYGLKVGTVGTEKVHHFNNKAVNSVRKYTHPVYQIPDEIKCWKKNATLEDLAGCCIKKPPKKQTKPVSNEIFYISSTKSLIWDGLLTIVCLTLRANYFSYLLHNILAFRIPLPGR